MLDAGESFRGSVHYVAGSLFAVMCAYNSMTACEGIGARRRHLFNAALYGALALYEARQVHRHWTYA